MPAALTSYSSYLDHIAARDAADNNTDGLALRAWAGVNQFVEWRWPGRGPLIDRVRLQASDRPTDLRKDFEVWSRRPHADALSSRCGATTLNMASSRSSLPSWPVRAYVAVGSQTTMAARPGSASSPSKS